MANTKFQILHTATKGMIYHQKRASDLINGYIKKLERKLKLTPTNFIYYVVLDFHQGKEQFVSNKSDLLYQNHKKSVKIAELWPRCIIRLPLKHIWNVKNPINIEWRLFALSEDCQAQCDVGCNIVGYDTRNTYMSLRCHAFYIWTAKEEDSRGDQIRLRIEIRLDGVIVKLDRKQSNDDFAEIGNWKQYEYIKDRLDEIETDEDLFVMPIIEFCTNKEMRDGKGLEMHLISHCVTFEM